MNEKQMAALTDRSSINNGTRGGVFLDRLNIEEFYRLQHECSFLQEKIIG